MGVDVLLYAEKTLIHNVDYELQAASALFDTMSSLGDPWRTPLTLEYLDYSWLPAPRVQVQTLARYYSPWWGLDRGNWSQIYTGIRALQKVFPMSNVYYGGDSSDNGELVTEELLAIGWMSWLGLKERDVPETSA